MTFFVTHLCILGFSFALCILLINFHIPLGLFAITKVCNDAVNELDCPFVYRHLHSSSSNSHLKKYADVYQRRHATGGIHDRNTSML